MWRTGVLMAIQEKATYSRIKSYLEERYERTFSYGTQLLSFSGPLRTGSKIFA